jgi:hypothetical protein
LNQQHHWRADDAPLHPALPAIEGAPAAVRPFMDSRDQAQLLPADGAPQRRSRVVLHQERSPGSASAATAMDRVANPCTSTVTDVYDRHGYADEDKRIMAAVARHVIGLVEGTETSNVISLR